VYEPANSRRLLEVKTPDQNVAVEYHLGSDNVSQVRTSDGSRIAYGYNGDSVIAKTYELPFYLGLNLSYR
ncbi:MAG: hypothetical protein KDD43_00145, partial [Bdellovibrionales bacterium]|nr:hypothetical protein [Bdellovibrionales bacterium]